MWAISDMVASYFRGIEYFLLWFSTYGLPSLCLMTQLADFLSAVLLHRHLIFEHPYYYHTLSEQQKLWHGLLLELIVLANSLNILS